MKNTDNQGSIDQQYLRAMNIDLWVERGAVELPVEAAETVTLGGMSAAEFGSAIGARGLELQQTRHDAELLVITEESKLSAESSKLLESMCNAIELGPSFWVQAGLEPAEATSAITLATLQDSQQFKAVVVMLRTMGDASALAQLRKAQHSVSGLRPPVMVTFHPQDLLDNPETKRPAWEDLKLLRQWLG